MGDHEVMLRAVAEREDARRRGGLLVLFALALVLGCLPWMMEGASLPRAESRGFLLERFLRVQWLLGTGLTGFVAAKRMKAGDDVKRAFALSVLFALELLLASAPLAALLHDMGVGSGRAWMGSELELFSYLAMVAALAVLLHLMLEPPLAALGATYSAAGALLWTGGGLALWLALGASAIVLAVLRAHGSPLHER